MKKILILIKETRIWIENEQWSGEIDSDNWHKGEEEFYILDTYKSDFILNERPIYGEPIIDFLNRKDRELNWTLHSDREFMKRFRYPISELIKQGFAYVYQLVEISESKAKSFQRAIEQRNEMYSLIMDINEYI